MQFTSPEQSDWCDNMPIRSHTIIPQFYLASFPGPAQLSVACSTASDGKLGEGLGTRLSFTSERVQTLALFPAPPPAQLPVACSTVTEAGRGPGNEAIQTLFFHSAAGRAREKFGV